MENVLVVVDMQNDLVNQLKKGEREKFVEKVSDKVDSYKNNGDTVLFTKNGKLAGDTLWLDGPIENPGWEIIPVLSAEGCDVLTEAPGGGYPFWNDYTYDADTTFELVGLYLDQAVISNAIGLKAAFPDSPVLVDLGCCEGTTEEGEDAACVIMRGLGIEAENG